ncbi:multicopper oxidase family protein [Silvimonas amylolytica]|uniref:Copper oxidase n=1 Tax=Silvimonas amylolytica TaxID=449663 RepID=A0ABQ2PI95_9NEIS|nr:multicopper oxidase family protein [Silvimonas amylolytica]GGP25202.1 copper oxidase [Silvimonas amylolytica]
MDRRSFLRFGSLAVGTLALAPRTWAAEDPHAGHMTMATTETPPLLPVGDLPTGRALPALQKLKNQSNPAGQFQATLTAAPRTVQFKPGLDTVVWAYNGQTPGPLIEIYEGDVLEIRLVNQLAQPTTIHWHGLPVPPSQDGNPGDEVAPGAERTYRFALPAGSAGTYWYHPHPHGHTAEQAFMGLAGPLIVRSRLDPLAGMPEQHLVFSDLKLGADGKVVGNNDMDWMNGREGQFVLVNGALQPVITADGMQRWRLWNMCNARYLNLSLGGQPFRLVGTDGGLLEHARAITQLLLAPGERAEIVVMGNSEVSLQALAYDRGMMGDAPPPQTLTLAKVTLSGGATRPIPSHLRQITPLSPGGAQKRVVFSEQMNMAGGVHSMTPLVNGKSYDMNRVDLVSQRGVVEAWSLVNDSDMDHPFHLHGTQFQIASRTRNGQTVPEPFLAWRDTINLRPNETVVIHVVQPQAGPRMFHCHILEHEDRGMMGILSVV